MKKIIKYMCVLAVAAIATIIIMYNMSSAEGENQQPETQPPTMSAGSVSTSGDTATIIVSFGGDIKSVTSGAITIDYPDGISCSEGNSKLIDNTDGITSCEFTFTGFSDYSENTADITFAIGSGGSTWNYISKSDNSKKPSQTTLTATAKVTIEKTEPVDPPEEDNNFTLSFSEVSMKVGESRNLPEISPQKDVTWTLGNSAIAIINEDKVVAMGEGETIFVATAGEGENAVSKELKVIVTAANTEDNEFDLLYSEISVGVNKSTPLPGNKQQKNVSWESKNPDIAIIKDNAAVGVSEGKTIFVATAGEGENAVSRELNVIVTAATQSPDPGEDPGNNPSQPVVDNDPPTIEPKTMKMLVGEVNRFGTDKEVTWSSSNNSIAIINKSTGQVTAVGEGKVTITATAKNGKKATAQVEVVRGDGREYLKPVISPNSDFTINVGDTYQLNCENGIPVEWSSTDETIAIVDSNGVVKGIGGGDALIYAKSKDSMVSSVKVTVKGAPAKKKSGGTTTNKTGNVATDNGNSSSTVNEEVPSTGEASTGTIIILGAVTLIVAAVLFRKRMK